MHLYLHIPFCKQACHYCDFHFSTNLSAKTDLVNAICQEIALQKNYLSSCSLETIYFGGGTPSLLTESELGQIFETIHRIFDVQQEAEITLEANPDDLTVHKINDLKTFVNRLSIGIQSFHEPHLLLMNRAHNAIEAENCVRIAQDAGLENLTIDLMYGLPFTPPQPSPKNRGGSFSKDIWQQNLDKATALDISHISAYCLTIEEKTAFGKWLKKGKLTPIDEETAAQQFETLVAHLTTHQYEQYEISSFARAGQYARHNSSYWKRRAYLGVGPSAHSFSGTSRQYNVANNSQYINVLGQNKIPCVVEELTISDQINDYLLTSLRTVWGCDLRVVRAIGGNSWESIQQPTIEIFIKENWLQLNDEVLYLTPKGKLFVERISSDLFLV